MARAHAPRYCPRVTEPISGTTPLQAREHARRLLRHEAAGAHDPRGLARAVQCVCSKLRGELTGLIGDGGVTALGGRALSLARREYPLLRPVEAGPDMCYTGLPEALEAAGAAEAEAASAALIEHFLGLLVLLVGEDLGLRPVHKLWPEGAVGDAPSGPTEKDP